VGAKIGQGKRISASGGRKDEVVPAVNCCVESGRIVPRELLGRGVSVTRHECYSVLLRLRRRLGGSDAARGDGMLAGYSGPSEVQICYDDTREQ
jgi:hypothetical protein